LGKDVTVASKGAKSKPKVSDTTFEETKYLKHLVDEDIRVRIRLENNEEVTGIIEFYDTGFLRLTREGGPNLFVFKHDIKYLYELDAE
jgi:host factor-I protein